MLGRILIQGGKVTEAQIQEALRLQRETTPRERIGEILRRTAALPETDLIEALAELHGIESVLAVPDDWIDPALVKNLPVDWARSRHMLPIRRNGKTGVLLADPTSMSDQNALNMLLGCEAVPVLAPAREVDQAIQRCYVSRRETAGDFLREMKQAAPETPAPATEHAQDLLRAVDSAPVTQLVNLILLEAVKKGASDIHLEPLHDRLRVRYRMDGMLYEQSTPPKHIEAALISRLKIMAHLDIAEKRLPQDGMAQVRIGDREVDIRLSTIPVSDGERVVLRLLNAEQVIRPLEELGMPDSVLRPLTGILAETHGAVWVTGPTGSGKTTTLYAALQALDTRRRNVLTIEDPIEYKLPNIGQMAVKPKIGLDFAQGLRHILRQDPDVILVGETRDLETAEIAVRASLTGHLVFSTLHTNDAPGAVVRLIDMGIPAYLVASATRGILAQRLVRVLCPSCSRPAAPAPELREAFGDRLDLLRGSSPREATGCDRCRDGYRGRTGLYEWIGIDDPLRAIIRRGGGPEDLIRHVKENNIPDLLADALEKARQGLTSLAEIQRVLGRGK